jgi:hypothetical protein
MIEACVQVGETTNQGDCRSLIWRERHRADRFAQRDQEGFASQLFWRDALKFEVPNLFIVAPSLFTAYPEKTPR